MTEISNEQLSIPCKEDSRIRYAGSLISTITRIQEVLDDNDKIKSYNVYYGYGEEEHPIEFEREIVEGSITTGDWILILYGVDSETEINIYSKSTFNANKTLDYIKDHLINFVNKEFPSDSFIPNFISIKQTDETDKIEGYLVDEQNSQPEEEEVA